MNAVSPISKLFVALVCGATLLLPTDLPAFAYSSTNDLPVLTLPYDVGWTAWNNSLDPANSGAAQDAAVDELMNAGMVKILPNNRVVGDLASHWRVSKNRRVYTFYLRKNLRFNNGDPLTAQDAVWSITRAAGRDVVPQLAASVDNLIVGLDAYSQGRAHRIGGLKALNSRTLQVTISRPAAYFLASFTNPTTSVLDPRVEQGHPVGSYMTNTCTSQVGAGPFKVVCQNSGSDVTSYYPAGSTPALSLIPNPYYYGHKPHIRLSIPVISDATAAYQTYRTGGLDVTSIPPTEVSQWQRTKDFHEWRTFGVQTLQPNTTAPPFNNRHCRLAVAYAWDRNTIAYKIFRGTLYRPYYVIVPPGLLGAYSGKDSPHYNLQRARIELAQCPGGVHVRLPWWTPGVDQHSGARALQAMMAQSGIDIMPYDVTSAQMGTYRTHNMRETGISLLLANWWTLYPDPQAYVSAILGDPTANIGNWHNATFLRLTHRADLEGNPRIRANLYMKAQKLAIHDGALIPGFNWIGTALVHPYVHGLVFMPLLAQMGVRPLNGDWSKVSIAKH